MNDELAIQYLEMEAKIHWHVARKPLMDAVRATEKLFTSEFVKHY